MTREQITRYRPPANPAKKTDPRSKKFIKKHGSQSWEVDALRPEVLNTLLESSIRSLIDEDLYFEIIRQEEADVKKIKLLAKKF